MRVISKTSEDVVASDTPTKANRRMELASESREALPLGVRIDVEHIALRE